MSLNGGEGYGAELRAVGPQGGGLFGLLSGGTSAAIRNNRRREKIDNATKGVRAVDEA